MSDSGWGREPQKFKYKWSNLTLLWAHLPLFGILIVPSSQRSWGRGIFGLPFIRPWITKCFGWNWILSSRYFEQPKWNGSKDMNLVNYFLVQTDGQKAMYKSPPCMSTVWVKNTTVAYQNPQVCRYPRYMLEKSILLAYPECSIFRDMLAVLILNCPLLTKKSKYCVA